MTAVGSSACSNRLTPSKSVKLKMPSIRSFSNNAMWNSLESREAVFATSKIFSMALTTHAGAAGLDSTGSINLYLIIAGRVRPGTSARAPLEAKSGGIAEDSTTWSADPRLCLDVSLVAAPEPVCKTPPVLPLRGTATTGFSSSSKSGPSLWPTALPAPGVKPTGILLWNGSLRWSLSRPPRRLLAPSPPTGTCFSSVLPSGPSLTNVSALPRRERGLVAICASVYTPGFAADHL